MKSLVGSALLALSLGTAAQAVTVTNTTVSGLGTDPFVAGSVTLPGGSSWFDAPDIEVGSAGGLYRTPFEGGTGAGTAQFFNVTADNSPAILVLNSVQTSLRLLWGSVDTYNTLELFLGNSLVATVTSANMVNPQFSTGAEYVTISGQAFDEVRFLSSTNSFEFAAIAAVPLPAGGLLLIGALGAFAVLRRRTPALA
jgi:hypothetical protein